MMTCWLPPGCATRQVYLHWPSEQHVTTAMGEREAWLTLASVTGVGESIFWGLIAAHGGAAEALGAVASGWKPPDDEWRIIRSTRLAITEAFRDPGAVADRVAALGLWTVTPLDPGYPQRLRDIDPPPAVIFGWGDPACLTAVRTVAVVGTRRPTLPGRQMAARIATRLAEAGAVVVSGLAMGIDGAAHAATVNAGGLTVAVIGGGHSHPGPGAHRGLTRTIVDTGGAVISELAPDKTPTKGTFPRRNRIISALATPRSWSRRRHEVARSSRRATRWSRAAPCWPCLGDPATRPWRAACHCCETRRHAPSRASTR